jgi:dihydrofolate reductase
MLVSIIAAVAENGVIGLDGKLPWHLSADLRRFKRLTMGHTLIMGRRTWESISRPLPGRRMIVVTRQANYRPEAPGIKVASGLEISLAFAAVAGGEEVFVIGGAELYRHALSRSDRIYLTRVDADVTGDTYFPHVNWNEWQLVESEKHAADERNEFAYAFEIYERTSEHR